MNTPSINTILSFSAILISIITIIYTRSNIKLQKYIDTITTQRIKWIESLRVDLSAVLAGLYLLKYYNEIESNYEAFRQMPDYGYYEDEAVWEYESNANKAIERFSKLKDEPKLEIMQKIDTAILRLNQEDDIHLIELLENARRRIATDNYLSPDSDDYIKDIRQECAMIFKKEWEKVKLETMKGVMKNGKKRIASSWLP